jgi:hypothetical protein
MRRADIARWTVLVAAVLSVLPVAARAEEDNLDLDHINVQYNGGPLMKNVQIVNLFWGPGWKQDAKQHDLAVYLNSFFQDLFADGRFMANLAQYGTDKTPIGNGRFVSAAVDAHDPPARVNDRQIQTELRAGIAAGALPPPDANTLYFVYTPPGVVVELSKEETSENAFEAYHSYSPGSGSEPGFAYAAMPYKDDHPVQSGNPRLMTDAASHELAEAVTDPQPYNNTLGWYDEHNGEIGDIPVYLYYYHRIGTHELWDVLEGSGGQRYLVQKMWSVKDGGPVAFAGATVNQAVR